MMPHGVVVALALLAVSANAAQMLRGSEKPVDVYALRQQVLQSDMVQKKIAVLCKTRTQRCESQAGDTIFCQLLNRSHPALAAEHCSSPNAPAKESTPVKQSTPAAEVATADAPRLEGALLAMKKQITSEKEFQGRAAELASTMGCGMVKKANNCNNYVKELSFCLWFAQKLATVKQLPGAKEEQHYCDNIDNTMPALSMVQQEEPPAFMQIKSHHSRVKSHGSRAPEDDLAKEMTHDLEMNFNKIAPFGKEDTAKELQDHAAKTQDTLVDAVENAEVAEIKRAVFRALTRLRAATIKEFDTIARLETQAIDAYNDAHHYRAENPLAHLHEDEAPVETDKLKSFH
mmetsp:Transcript_55372/g.103967  ORF Transcript_55372/g.103967 Transcript_55372/m.103967 type:complete len:345 (+) Transcript_55372:76-1110(+)